MQFRWFIVTVNQRIHTRILDSHHCSLYRASICINNAPIKRLFDYFKTESDDIKKQDIFEKVVTGTDNYIYFYNNKHFQVS